MPDSPVPAHFNIAFHPVADPQALVTAGKARFSLLTARLVRMEYSPSGQFEDHPSQVFWHRQQPVPPFEVNRAGAGDERLELHTGALRLSYTTDPAGFSPENLTVQVLATGRTWHYGERDSGNLRGTTRTLDGADGPARLEPGLLSRLGWAVVDDSHSLVFDPDGWVQPRAHPENLDLYFFGHGHDYLGALSEFAQVAGPAPLLPRWALGNWWSRYWAYTQAEYLALMDEFRAHGVPLSVAIVDMDWHITRTGNTSTGWTGYTWNRQLFPDPPAFLAGLKARGLRTALNIHPAEGIHPHEEQYPEMARRLGIDPASQEPLPFDIADPAFTQAYFEVLHHPNETQGVNFWWIDWQQGGLTRLPGLDPLYWLNHLYFYDLGRDGRRRPFIFSRWPGLGGHRYPIGFSGDTVISWASLAFQPYFTATASNVAYSWWSHDIGGHMGGVRDPELYARWVQYGVFSPILRLHSTSNRFLERRPWGYSPEIEQAASAALRLRAALAPYLYSMAWRTHRAARPLVQPMYYLYPEAEEAFACRNQYLFGSELLAAPFVTPRDPDTRLASQTLWLPPGDWFDFFRGEFHPGGRWLTQYGGLDETPVLARAGAIVPLEGDPGNTENPNPQSLVLHLFPGASNAFELYEDDGETQDYLQGRYCLTRLALKWGGDRLVFSIEPGEGELSPLVVPAQRTYHLVFHGLRQPDALTVQVDGAALTPTPVYAEDAGRLELGGISMTPHQRLEVSLSVAEGSLLDRRDRRSAAVERLLLAFNLGANACHAVYNALPAILSGRASLRQFANRLKPAQLEALETVIRET
jgi:hypothetical protein